MPSKFSFDHVWGEMRRVVLANFLLIIFTFQEFLHRVALYNLQASPWFITQSTEMESASASPSASARVRQAEVEAEAEAEACQSGTARELLLLLTWRMRCARWRW